MAIKRRKQDLYKKGRPQLGVPDGQFNEVSGKPDYLEKKDKLREEIKGVLKGNPKDSDYWKKLKKLSDADLAEKSLDLSIDSQADAKLHVYKEASLLRRISKKRNLTSDEREALISCCAYFLAIMRREVIASAQSEGRYGMAPKSRLVRNKTSRHR